MRLSFAANRRIHGSWQSSLPSRFISELPEDISTPWSMKASMAAIPASATMRARRTFTSGYESPGWKRAQANRAASGGVRTRPPMIEAQSYTVQTSDPSATQYAKGDRVFHHGGYSGFRDNAGAESFNSGYESPGWKRAQANRAASGGVRTRPPVIEAHAYSVQTSDPSATHYAKGDRVFHQKFGYGNVSFRRRQQADGGGSTIPGKKKVIDTFVSPG